ncbi:MAG: phosphate acetyltransferase [Propionibacteriaceae bacterium]|nr:phosphate acetyltransferase [Propionibacteriaceae bacterium]
MTNSVYVLAPEAMLGKSAIALGAIESLTKAGLRVGAFRPIMRTDAYDSTLETMLETADTGQDYNSGCGVTYAHIREDIEAAITDIIMKFEALKSQFDSVVILGSDYADVIQPIEFALNVRIAANLNTPTLLVVSGRGRTPADLHFSLDFAQDEINQASLVSLGVVAVGLDADYLDDYKEALADLPWPIAETVPGVVASMAKMPDGFPAMLEAAKSTVRTPLMFQYELMQRARADKRTIVLPESTDDRILTSASIILKREIADIILLGNRAEIQARALELELDLSKARIQDPTDPGLLDKFATEYAKLRAHKGITVDEARETFKDLSYFGTMMIHMGLADGMVSGAIHTTANTIRPSLEFIKTKPGVNIVSGYFLMCLPDRVLVFADCAVNTNPSEENLADIAIASAGTAASFGIEPRVALLSYSTGLSGFGPDVDMVREAYQILHERAPELPAEGPIQFDAAVDETVAKTKLPDSVVAGHATVFVFPDLNTGNITYKAVQRTANALAIGPILQGLRKPVNDLSRGALVADIVNTVAITAIQAQEDLPAKKES